MAVSLAVRLFFRSLRFALWGIALLVAGSLQAQLSLRVLDYNIHRDIGASDSDIAAQPALAKIVNFLQPDIWTINELGGNNVNYNAANALAALDAFIHDDLNIFGLNPQRGVNYYVYVGTLTDNYITNAIVSRYPLLSTHTYIDAGDDFGRLRGLVQAVVDLPGAIDVSVFTAHLKALSTESDASRRQDEADADALTVKNWRNAHVGQATLLTGDFNVSEDAGDFSNWSGHQIGDAFPDGEIYHPITTLKSTGLADARPVSITGKADTIDSSSPTSRFDYQLYSADRLTVSSSQIFDTKQYTSPQLAALNAANGTSFVAGDSATASDHLPVFVIYNVVPEPGALSLLGVALIGAIAFRRRR